MSRELGAGERPEVVSLRRSAENPEALDPVNGEGVVPLGFPPLFPWYEVPPGGPRFLQGVPGLDFSPNPFNHVVLDRNPRRYNAGRFRGNTGFGDGTGAISESAKTGMTGLFLVASVALLFFVYGKR